MRYLLAILFALNAFSEGREVFDIYKAPTIERETIKVQRYDERPGSDLQRKIDDFLYKVDRGLPVDILNGKDTYYPYTYEILRHKNTEDK